MHRILVTGGAGFIGSHTVNLLLGKNMEVTVLDNLSSGRLENLDLTHRSLRFIKGDILDYPLVQDLVNEADAILHLAAIASVPLSLENPLYTFQINELGFLNLIQAVKLRATPPRLVYASSAAVYGNTHILPSHEDIATSPALLSPYALHKKHNEEHADLYHRLYGLPSTALRYFNVYGPGQDPQSAYSGVISRFTAAYKNDQPLTIFGNGSQSRDFIHVTDVAHANYLALTTPFHGVLNIASGQPQTLLDIIRYLEKPGQPARLCFAPARTGDIHTSYAASQNAWHKIGFRATISLQTGLQMLIDMPKIPG